MDKAKKSARETASLIIALLLAGLLVFVLITFVFRSYAVDGPSMETTLQNNDKLIVWKLPRTIAKITGNQYVPNRGDIIIVQQDSLAACGKQGSNVIIKRVIGLPGERVVAKDGAYTVYNAQNPNGFNPDKTLDYNKDGHIPATNGSIEVTLKADQLFISGDNRPKSCDSRELGPIQTNHVIGKLVVRLLPFGSTKLF